MLYPGILLVLWCIIVAMRLSKWLPLFVCFVFTIIIIVSLQPKQVIAESQTYSLYCSEGQTLEQRPGNRPIDSRPSTIVWCSGGGDVHYDPPILGSPSRLNDVGYRVDVVCEGEVFIWPHARSAGEDDPRAPEVHFNCEDDARPSSVTITELAAGAIDPEPPRPDIEEDDEPEVDCDAGSGFTWIICGMIRLIQGFINFVMDEIIIPFLEISPLVRTNDDGSETAPFAIWRGVRTLANVLLIPVFLILIFAQAFSLKIDAYTIKKALPRIAIVAILIQLSYYMVGIMVDITNVVGNGIGDLLMTPLKDSEVQLNFRSGTSRTIFIAGLSFGAITVVGTAFTGALFTALIGLGAAMLLVFLTLVFRQILIISLAIFTPIALAAWVLPSTDKLAKIWWNLLSRSLMMYPLIVILFSAGTLVATIASSNARGGGVDDQGIGTVIAIGALVAPLAMVPLTFKLAGAAVAGLAAILQKGKGVAMGGRDGRGGIMARRRETEARRKREAQGGELLDKSGFAGWARRPVNTLARFSTTPGSFLKPTKKGRNMSRGVAAAGMVGASNDAAKSMQEEGFTDVDALRHIAEYGGGKNSIKTGSRNFKNRGMYNAAEQLEAFGGKYAGSVEHRAGAVLLLASQGKADDKQIKSLDRFVSNKAVKSAVLAQALAASSRAGRKEHSRVVSGLDREGNISLLSDKMETDASGNYTGHIKEEFRASNGSVVEGEIQNLILESGPQQFSQMDPKAIRALAPLMAQLASQESIVANPNARPGDQDYGLTIPRQKVIDQIAVLTHSSAYNNPRSKQDIEEALDRYHIRLDAQVVDTPSVRPDYIPNTRPNTGGGAGGAGAGGGAGGAGAPSGGQTGPTSPTRTTETQVMVRDMATGTTRESPHYIDTSRLENAVKQRDGTLADKIGNELRPILDPDGHPVLAPVMIKNPTAGAPNVDNKGGQIINRRTIPARNVPLRDLVTDAQRGVRPGDATQGRGSFDNPNEPPDGGFTPPGSDGS
jgi:hypothetical protein